MTTASRPAAYFPPRPRRPWRVGVRSLELGRRTLIMAILNLTPDSFHAASRVAEGDLCRRAEQALELGADLLDLGAESTRPGAAAVSSEQEWERLAAPLAALRRALPAALLSIDTRHATTARRALAAGANIINDVSGLGDPAMAPLLAAGDCGAVLMHARGSVETMHRLPPLADPLGCVQQGLTDIVAQARQAGVADDRILLDPGFGFGKNLDENFPLLAGLHTLAGLGLPLLIGVSRKSFLGHVIGNKPAEQRLAATLAAQTAAVLAGAHVLRVHDVAEGRQAAAVADAVLAAGLATPDERPDQPLGERRI